MRYRSRYEGFGAKVKPSASIVLTILALIGLALIFAQYEYCGRYHPDPYVSPCEDSLASEFFPNSLAYFFGSHRGTLTVAANLLFIAALWSIPWLRMRSWRRTFVSVFVYVLGSAALAFVVIDLTL